MAIALGGIAAFGFVIYYGVKILMSTEEIEEDFEEKDKRSEKDEKTKQEIQQSIEVDQTQTFVFSDNDYHDPDEISSLGDLLDNDPDQTKKR
jgi:hypothetical protein